MPGPTGPQRLDLNVRNVRRIDAGDTERNEARCLRQ